MYFLQKKKTVLLLSIAVILLAYLLWKTAVKEVWDPLSGQFTPVNEQMQSLLGQVEKDAGADAEANAKDKAAAAAKDPSTTIQQTPAASARPETTPEQVETAKDVPEQAPSAHAAASARVELNSASLEQLDALPGIGESKAKAILAYRAERGRFKQVEELLEVKGIGEKILEKLKPFIYIAKP